MGLVVLAVLAAVCLGGSEARPHRSPLRRFPGVGRLAQVQEKRSQAAPPPVVEMYTQILDHFNQVCKSRADGTTGRDTFSTIR